MLAPSSREPFALSSAPREDFSTQPALLYVEVGYWDYDYVEELLAYARDELALATGVRDAFALTSASRSALSP